MSFKQLQRTWDTFGRQDPLWAILSHKDKRGNRWQLDDFMDTGRKEIQEVLDYARSLGQELPMHKALDFGCGVGRLTQALADHFQEVCGVDVAASMLDRARELNRQGERCTYHLNQATDLSLFPDGEFDFVYSNITLQHMRPELAAAYIRELCRVLSPAGMLIFQLPADLEPGRLGTFVVRLKRALYLLWTRTLRRRPVMDMFGTPPDRVRQLVTGGGARVLDVQENQHAGAGWTSYRYCVVRG
ncbi:MAG: class I SAM-dependent methyltransferase [Planctomycetota bacterium]|jgi:SAM-dependent methyltransferase